METWGKQHREINWWSLSADHDGSLAKRTCAPNWTLNTSSERDNMWKCMDSEMDRLILLEVNNESHTVSDTCEDSSLNEKSDDSDYITHL